METLLSKFNEPIQEVNKNPFIGYINFLEGSKTRIKNIHWAINNTNVREKVNAHKYLDDLHDDVSSLQDTLAECSQGIYGDMLPNEIQGEQINALNPSELISIILDRTFKTLSLCSSPSNVGIKAELENFIGSLNKYAYLFNLTK